MQIIHNDEKRIINNYFIFIKGLTTTDLSKKMNSLRTYYGREVGKEKASRTSGKGTNDVYNSRWPFFNSLHFLRDNITPRKTISTISIPSSSTSPVPPDEDCNLDVMGLEAENSETTFGIDLAQQLDTAPMALSTPPSQAKRKRNAKEISVEDEVLECCLKELQQKTPTPRQSVDELFGSYVGRQLAKVPEGYGKENVKIKIQQLIVRAMHDDSHSRVAVSAFDFD